MHESRYVRLMEVKERLVEAKQRDLGTAVEAANAVANEISKVEADISTRREAIEEKPFKGTEFMVIRDYLLYLASQRKSLLQDKEKREDLINRLRVELCALTVELKTLERLQVEVIARARKEQNRKEQNLMDNLALRGR